MVRMKIKFQGPTSQLMVFIFGGLGLKVTANFLMTRSVRHTFCVKRNNQYILFFFLQAKPALEGEHIDALTTCSFNTPRWSSDHGLGLVLAAVISTATLPHFPTALGL